MNHDEATLRRDRRMLWVLGSFLILVSFYLLHTDGAQASSLACLGVGMGLAALGWWGSNRWVGLVGALLRGPWW